MTTTRTALTVAALAATLTAGTAITTAPANAAAPTKVSAKAGKWGPPRTAYDRCSRPTPNSRITNPTKQCVLVVQARYKPNGKLWVWRKPTKECRITGTKSGRTNVGGYVITNYSCPDRGHTLSVGRLQRG